MFRGVKVHRSGSTCKDWTGLEIELVAEMKAEPDNPEVVMRLLRLLQCDGPPRGRIVEAYQLCLERQKDWRGSADWQSAVQELCDNFKVRNCNNHACGSEPCYVLRTYKLWAGQSTACISSSDTGRALLLPSQIIYLVKLTN